MAEYGEAGSAGSSVSGGVFPPLVRHDLQLLGIRHLPACGIYPLLVGSRAYEDGAKMVFLCWQVMSFTAGGTGGFCFLSLRVHWWTMW